MERFLEGKNIVVTGSNKGIGKAIMTECAENGANIWACMRSSDDELLKEIRSLQEDNNVWIRPVYFDLNKEDEINAAAKQILSEKIKIDAIVNNAGVTGPNRLFSMTSMNEIKEVFQTNLFGPLQLTQKLLRSMIKNRDGVIVNVASAAAIDGNPAQLEYVSSKAAVVGATKKLANELGSYGIRVNAVAPGVTNTEMIGQMKQELLDKTVSNTIMKRPGEPKEIAGVVVFLASKLSGYMTGQVLRVDGGMPG